MIAMNCYFDGSVGGQSDEWLALGGFIATDPTWAKFQTDWKAMLQNRDPVADYLHMTDLLADSGARRKGFRGERENDSGVKANGIPG